MTQVRQPAPVLFGANLVWLKCKGGIEPWTLAGANPPSQQTLVVDLWSLSATTCLTVFIYSYIIYIFNGYIS